MSHSVVPYNSTVPIGNSAGLSVDKCPKCSEWALLPGPYGSAGWCRKCGYRSDEILGGEILPPEPAPAANGHQIEPEAELPPLPSHLKRIMDWLRRDWNKLDRGDAVRYATFHFHKEGGSDFVEHISGHAIGRGTDPELVELAMAKGLDDWIQQTPSPKPKSKPQAERADRTDRSDEKPNKIGQNPKNERQVRDRSQTGPRQDGITLAVLQSKKFEPVKFVVPGLITEGVNLLVSRPKLGKSWMILDVGIAAASNRYTLGNIKPLQGDVLYLALEDSERRLQTRVDKLLGAFIGKWPDRMTIYTKWSPIDRGGIEELAKWCDSVSEPVLIIIDVFAKVRPTGTKNVQLYESDYRAVGLLQEFAIARGLAVVLVHHDRKMGADDPFDTVSGSHGLTGAADTILILKRTANGVVLYARGRDIEEAELALEFNKHSCKWTILGTAAEVRRSDERTRVIEALRKANGPLSPKAIKTMADLASDNATWLLLGRMAEAGEIERVGKGQYALPVSPVSPVDPV